MEKLKRLWRAMMAFMRPGYVPYALACARGKDVYEIWVNPRVELGGIQDLPGVIVRHDHWVPASRKLTRREAAVRAWRSEDET